MIELVDWLKTEYGFKQVEFINEAIILTDQGRKRIRSWSDSSLLEWHIEWRDYCHHTPVVLTDRMIRTKDDKTYAKWRDHWISLHDDIEEKYPEQDHESAWGMLIGLMIKYGLQTDYQTSEHIIEREAFKVNPTLLRSVTFSLYDQLKKYEKEALIRMKKAEVIKESLKEVQRPIMDRIQTTSQARRVFDVLFWSGTSEEPEVGYRSLQTFLKQWLRKNGQDSVNQLIYAIGQTEGFCREQALWLVAECLKPYEWLRVKEAIEGNESEENIEGTLRDMSTEWEEARVLVQLLSRWIDEQKKVVT